MTATLRPSTGSPAERFTSRNPDDFAVPRGREEQWRFTPLRRIREFFEPFEPAGTETVTVDAPEGVRADIVGRDHPLFGTAAQPADRVAALALAGAADVLLVEI